MAKNGLNWEGLLKWSLSHSNGSRSSRHLSENDRRWFMEAMQAHSVDSIKRMKEITQIMRTPEQVLVAQGVTPGDIEGMLDELQEHVESIDMANDLHSIGGLAPLLGYLKNSHAKIRAKAADVLTTIVQNNPRSQQLVLEANGLEFLLANFVSDHDLTVRIKALSAISSLIRHNKPGITAFRLANGYAGLRDALISENESPESGSLSSAREQIRLQILTDLGFPRTMIHLASNDDMEVREFALRGLLELARDKTDGSNGNLDKQDENLRRLLEVRIRSLISMSPEDLIAVREERQLVDTLWSMCYEEPSVLREEGLVYLPGDDEVPRDVTTEHFENPLRAWAAKRGDETRASATEARREIPLLLGPAP